MRTTRKRLLIIDDDRDALESLKLLLESSYDVCLAQSGVDALTEVNRGFHPEAVLLDLRMPTMDGAEVARELVRVGINAPVLVISAKPDAEEMARALGAADLLKKPFTYEQLKAKLEGVLKHHDPRGPGGGFLRGLFLLIPSRLGGA